MTEDMTQPEPLPQPEPTPAPIPAPTAGVPPADAPVKKRATVPAWAAAAALIIGGGGGYLIGNASGGDDTAATTTTVLTVDTVREAMQRCPDADAGASTITSIECGLFVTVYDDGGLEVNYFPEVDDNLQGSKAIDDIGTLTGCWSSSDRAKMGSTRALDGRVESANGRSSWTYHPDNGLNIICNPPTAATS